MASNTSNLFPTQALTLTLTLLVIALSLSDVEASRANRFLLVGDALASLPPSIDTNFTDAASALLGTKVVPPVSDITVKNNAALPPIAPVVALPPSVSDKIRTTAADLSPSNTVVPPIVPVVALPPSDKTPTKAAQLSPSNIVVPPTVPIVALPPLLSDTTLTKAIDVSSSNTVVPPIVPVVALPPSVSDKSLPATPNLSPSSTVVPPIVPVVALPPSVKTLTTAVDLTLPPLSSEDLDLLNQVYGLDVANLSPNSDVTLPTLKAALPPYADPKGKVAALPPIPPNLYGNRS